MSWLTPVRGLFFSISHTQDWLHQSILDTCLFPINQKGKKTSSELLLFIHCLKKAPTLSLHSSVQQQLATWTCRKSFLFTTTFRWLTFKTSRPLVCFLSRQHHKEESRDGIIEPKMGSSVQFSWYMKNLFSDSKHYSNGNKRGCLQCETMRHQLSGCSLRLERTSKSHPCCQSGKQVIEGRCCCCCLNIIDSVLLISDEKKWSQMKK